MDMLVETLTLESWHHEHKTCPQLQYTISFQMNYKMCFPEQSTLVAPASA